MFSSLLLIQPLPISRGFSHQLARAGSLEDLKTGQPKIWHSLQSGLKSSNNVNSFKHKKNSFFNDLQNRENSPYIYVKMSRTLEDYVQSGQTRATTKEQKTFEYSKII